MHSHHPWAHAFKIVKVCTRGLEHSLGPSCITIASGPTKQTRLLPQKSMPKSFHAVESHVQQRISATRQCAPQDQFKPAVPDVYKASKPGSLLLLKNKTKPQLHKQTCVLKLLKADSLASPETHSQTLARTAWISPSCWEPEQGLQNHPVQYICMLCASNATQGHHHPSRIDGAQALTIKSQLAPYVLMASTVRVPKSLPSGTALAPRPDSEVLGTPHGKKLEHDRSRTQTKEKRNTSANDPSSMFPLFEIKRTLYYAEGPSTIMGSLAPAGTKHGKEISDEWLDVPSAASVRPSTSCTSE